MINKLLGFFEDIFNEQVATEIPDENQIKLAAAALLLEVSRSDTSKQQIELESIAEILERDFNLPVNLVKELMAAANDKVEAAHDLFQFTQLINQHYDADAKRKLINAMWVVAFADGHIEAIEDHIIRRVAGLLHLAHEDFIKEKLRVRDALKESGAQL